MAVITSGNTITLTGFVGDHWVYGDEVIIDGFTQGMVLAALAEIGSEADLTVHINSGGGFVDDGESIRASLVARQGRTDVVVEGIAASAASIIAMAGERISMSEGSRMMIHDPANITFGTIADHEATIRQLTSAASAMASVYARRASMDLEEVRRIMREETWYDATAAVEAGFADAILGAKGQPIAAFPYQIYAHAPREMVAAARQNDWRLPPARPAACAAPLAAKPAAPSAPEKEIPMAEKPKAGVEAAAPSNVDQAAADAARDAVKADRDRRKSIMALENAKGREPLAEHLYAETDMTPEQIDATLATAPIASAKDPAPIPTIEDRAKAQAEIGAGPTTQSPTPSKARVDIVANMKRRNGIKS